MTSDAAVVLLIMIAPLVLMGEVLAALLWFFIYLNLWSVDLPMTVAIYVSYVVIVIISRAVRSIGGGVR